MEPLTRTTSNLPPTPTHWDRVPDLPAKGKRIALRDEQGYMAQYKVCMGGVWHLLRFWPAELGGIWLVSASGESGAVSNLEAAYNQMAAWQKVSARKLDPRPQITVNDLPF